MRDADSNTTEIESIEEFMRCLHLIKGGSGGIQVTELSHADGISEFVRATSHLYQYLGMTSIDRFDQLTEFFFVCGSQDFS
jgi:hypothetical protein